MSDWNPDVTVSRIRAEAGASAVRQALDLLSFAAGALEAYASPLAGPMQSAASDLRRQSHSEEAAHRVLLGDHRRQFDDLERAVIALHYSGDAEAETIAQDIAERWDIELPQRAGEYDAEGLRADDARDRAKDMRREANL